LIRVILHLGKYSTSVTCEVQNAECYIIMAVLMQPLFKLGSAADHTAHFIKAPKG